ncbi:MAG: ergothioneine biosynthesis protein EgtB [Pseudomonadota bacterium]
MTCATESVAERLDAPIARYQRVRATTMRLIASLEAEDCVVQSMPDVSPTKWHLAHVTWFFETFVLAEAAAHYRPFDDRFAFLFNSYYNGVGAMHARPERGLITRPTLATVIAYRQYVDDAMHTLLETDLSDAIQFRIELGLQHEQQHQELLLTDIQHVLSVNPIRPAMRDDLVVAPNATAMPMDWQSIDGGIISTGMHPDTPDFCYDNETPAHDTLLNDFAIANRPVTNGEYRDFINDGGYTTPSLWLSDGWATVNEQHWGSPLYWSDDCDQQFTLAGMRDIDWHAPVAYISFYEADAFARWAGARLPIEHEWEHVAANQPVTGNFADDDVWQPVGNDTSWFGNTWEWTASSYGPYPGFKPLDGSLGEYNGKFMCNQMVVRGGSCLSAADHLRATYRSFFYPQSRWQCLGLRLAKDR